LHTTALRDLLERFQSGDALAVEELWIADLRGTCPRTKGEPEDRGTLGGRPEMPPLTPLTQALQRDGVEQVEMLCFPVTAKEARR
jgi:hypothetical protein